MEELYLAAVKYHTMFLGCMLIIGFINLFFVFKAKEFSKKVKFLNPLYYMFFASIGFTGLIALAVNHLQIMHATAMMIVVFLVIFIMSIKLFKVYKKEPSETYRAFAKKKYSIDIALILVTIILVYMV